MRIVYSLTFGIDAHIQFDAQSCIACEGDPSADVEHRLAAGRRRLLKKLSAEWNPWLVGNTVIQTHQHNHCWKGGSRYQAWIALKLGTRTSSM